jgi:hypothetical protein
VLSVHVSIALSKYDDDDDDVTANIFFEIFLNLRYTWKGVINQNDIYHRIKRKLIVRSMS